MTLNVELITKVVIPILGIIATYIIAPYIKAKTEDQKWNNIYTKVKSGVYAAEQTLKIYDPTGEKRRKFVMDYIYSRNINLTIEDLDVMLEAAVKELNLEQKKL